MGDKTHAAVEKHRRQSLRVLPVYAVLTAVSGIIVLVTPRWWSWTIFAVTALTLLGDLLNVWVSAGFARSFRPIVPRSW